MHFFRLPHQLAIDNHRVLHGRSAFTGKRRMCGAYIGMDEFRSKLAVLSERFDARAFEAARTPVDGQGQIRRGAGASGHGRAAFGGRSVWSSGL